MNRLYTPSLLLLAFFLNFSFYAQDTQALLRSKEQRITELKNELESSRQIADSLRLLDIMERLERVGWPGDDGELVKHSAMALAYDEEHEMAKWVAHIILREVATGRTTRTNDFRVDPKVSTGTAEQEDYFITWVDDSGKRQYDGFGFDRGHLAASADFRWNQQALSESYFYSNMSPQRPGFNRESWAEVEDYVRSYAIENDVDLYVITGPVLSDDLPKIKRSPNKVSIPELHYKIAVDLENERSFAVLMPNKLCEKPVENYVVPIREIEELTGLNFFPNLDPQLAEKLETSTDYTPWLPKNQRGDVMMLSANDLEKGQYNTLQAYNFMDSNKKVKICGTVVSTFKSQKGNIFINLDKRFPNTVFTVSIWARDTGNFSYNPEVELENRRICTKGNVTSRDGIPQMNVSNEKQITFLDGEGL